MNEWVGIGNLAREPESRQGQTGLVCKFTVAINDGYGDKKETNYITVVTFGKTAENCVRFLHKGSKVAVHGRIKTGSYEKQDGTKVYTTEVISAHVEFLTPKGQGGQTQHQQTNQGGFGQPKQQSFDPAGFGMTEEDMPGFM